MIFTQQIVLNKLHIIGATVSYGKIQTRKFGHNNKYILDTVICHSVDLE